MQLAEQDVDRPGQPVEVDVIPPEQSSAVGVLGRIGRDVDGARFGSGERLVPWEIEQFAVVVLLDTGGFEI